MVDEIEKIGKGRSEGMTMTALDEITGFHMRKAVLRAQGTFASAAGRKLQTGQYSVMAIINENPGRTQTAIAEAAGLDRSSLVPVLNQFEKNGLIIREAVATDRRAYAVRLTKKGQRELADLETKVQEIEKKVVDGLGQENHALLIDLLKRFYEVI
ncbi:MarR family winged helix-turn-helix transcriptional regulator [Sneathiella sp.]|uniref:MarR family winged helix-turn-helix transcriptional regulator n=1 Tax=Sneathiella sp. TaxID=1964365 RepID=UPI003562F85A